MSESLCGCSVGLRFRYGSCYDLSVRVGGTVNDFKTILYISAAPVALLDATKFAILHGDSLAKRGHLIKTVQRRLQ